MKRPLPLVLFVLVPTLAAAQARPDRLQPILEQVDPARIHANVSTLVGFGTRHTLSDTKSDKRGIGAARRWLASEFQTYGKAPGARLRPFEDRFTAPVGPRIPAPVEVINVGAVLPGTDPDRAKEAIVLTGHYDSRSSDVLDTTKDAPGAVDDASGTALVMELARVMATEAPAISVYFVAVAGEEQGLVGSTHLAERLAAEGIRVLAMVSIDIAGNTEGQDGVKDNATARLFSEGVPAAETEAQKKLRDAIGSENDSPAREWARYVKRVAEAHVENLDLWVMLRRDRIARGSDHMPFMKQGVPAIRLSETHEHYDRQHQDVRIEKGRSYGDLLARFDPLYTAKLTRALMAAVATLAAAPAAPRDVVLGGAVSPETRLRWTLPPDRRIAGVVLYRRRADALEWQRVRRLEKTDHVTLPDVVPDNNVFAVATVDAEGRESLPIHPSALE